MSIFHKSFATNEGFSFSFFRNASDWKVQFAERFKKTEVINFLNFKNEHMH